jgi:LPS-assembly protein
VKINPRGKARLTHAVFRLFRVPTLYLPTASAPVTRLRESGLLLPHFSNSNNKGFIFGDSLFLAPTDWLDFTLGAELLSRRGVAQRAEIHARPSEESSLNASYFAVNDRGITDPSGNRIRQPGHLAHLDAVTKLGHGFRLVADINALTSQAFRLAFSETFQEAVLPDVNATTFLTNNSRGLYWNLFAAQYKSFTSISPEQTVILRSAPGWEFRSPDRPIPRLPVYFSWDASMEGLRRHDPEIETSEIVRRFNLAPELTVPIHLGDFLQILPTVGVGLTNYGGQLVDGVFVKESFNRFTQHASVDIRPPSLARVWNTPGGLLGDRVKHVIEPRIVYRYVNGVRDFARFVRFDALETMTDTSELEYSLTQRLFTRADSEGSAREWVSWKVAQKYYFDPTFGGALAEGQRNVFASFTSLTAFAFADRAKRFSPIISDIRFNPGGRLDAEYRLDFDPREGRVTASGLAVNSRPYKEFFLALAHFSVRNQPVLAPISNQIRFQMGYGSINRRGWNVLWGASYDFRQKFFPNNALQVSYNGACCGIAVEFRRLALGPIRAENQFRLALSIANLGTFGTVRRQERIF